MVGSVPDSPRPARSFRPERGGSRSLLGQQHGSENSQLPYLLAQTCRDFWAMPSSSILTYVHHGENRRVRRTDCQLVTWNSHPGVWSRSSDRSQSRALRGPKNVGVASVAGYKETLVNSSRAKEIFAPILVPYWNLKRAPLADRGGMATNFSGSMELNTKRSMQIAEL